MFPGCPRRKIDSIFGENKPSLRLKSLIDLNDWISLIVFGMKRRQCFSSMEYHDVLTDKDLYKFSLIKFCLIIKSPFMPNQLQKRPILAPNWANFPSWKPLKYSKTDKDVVKRPLILLIIDLNQWRPWKPSFWERNWWFLEDEHQKAHLSPRNENFAAWKPKRDPNWLISIHMSLINFIYPIKSKEALKINFVEIKQVILGGTASK